MNRREHRADEVLGRRRAARERIDLDAEATERLNKAREALGLNTKETP